MVHVCDRVDIHLCAVVHVCVLGVYIHVCAVVHAYVCRCTFMYLQWYMCVVCAFTYVQWYMCVCTGVPIHVCAVVHLCACTFTYVQWYMCMCEYVYLCRGHRTTSDVPPQVPYNLCSETGSFTVLEITN